MRNFLRLADGVDTMPLLHALQANEDLWNSVRTRTVEYETPHTDVDDILLRFNGATSPIEHLRHGLVMERKPAWDRLPQVRPFIFGLMRQIEAEQLGRVMISRLAPGKRILPHTDKVGAYSDHYRRYHLALQSGPGCLFRCGDETVQMRTGEVWTFDHLLEHEVANNSADDRIHLIVDLKPC